MTRKKFLRRTWSRYPKLGRRSKKKQVWRRPTGRDNKMRERRKGYSARAEVGYKKSPEISGRISGKIPVIVSNVKELEKIGNKRVAIIGRVGKRKKIEIVKKAKEKKIPVYNVNVEKFVKDLEKEEKKTKEKPKEKSKEEPKTKINEKKDKK